jgi:hypothetical protein
MKIVVTQFKVNVSQDDEANRHSDSKSNDVDKRIDLAFQQVSDRKDKVIS